MLITFMCSFPFYNQQILRWFLNITFVVMVIHILKMPQSGVGSMQEKNTGNMPIAVCASSMNKSLDPTLIQM